MNRTTEVDVRVSDVRDLFRDREFDPFIDDSEMVGSIARMAKLSHLVSQLEKIRLRVLVPPAQLTPQTQASVQRALARYCDYAIAEGRRNLAALRWVGLRTSLVAIVFFAISLAASAAVQRWLLLPEGVRTLASEALIVAGWVVIWQPLDTLVQGWWPQWEEERTFRALSKIPVRVEAAEPLSAQ